MKSREPVADCAPQFTVGYGAKAHPTIDRPIDEADVKMAPSPAACRAKATSAFKNIGVLALLIGCSKSKAHDVPATSRVPVQAVLETARTTPVEKPIDGWLDLKWGDPPKVALE